MGLRYEKCNRLGNNGFPVTHECILNFNDNV